MTIAHAIQQVRDSLFDSATRCQRSPQEIQLLAVSKGQPIECIRQAYAQGLCHFGENYLQEALQKIHALADLDITWHYIGHIQSNKTKLIAEHFDWVQTIDRIKIAQRLNDGRPENKPRLNVCIEVNLSEEQSKSGISVHELPQLVDAIMALPRLKLRGLMAIPAVTDDYSIQLKQFKRLTQTQTDLNYRFGLNLATLSMGMSNDYRAAIEAGSTMIRLGTALFGPRKQ